MLQIWTATYQYPGPYRLDITVKGQDPIGKILAPTWEMVKEYKKDGPKAEVRYMAEYKKAITRSKQIYPEEWEKLLKMNYAVLVCFCPYPNFCHRHLAAGELIKIGAAFHGEITDYSPWRKDKNIINSFKNEHSWLSNFYPVKMYHEGIWYNSNEHFYVAHKFHKDAVCLVPDPYNPDNMITIHCRQFAATCEKPKQFGKTAKLPTNWDKGLKDQIMSLGLDIKFEIPAMKEKLLATKGIELIEGNTWHDNYWGNCTCKKCITIPGQNKLGKMIMAKRDAIS